MNAGQKMINFYFGQTDHYMSEHQNTLVKIKDMHSIYAANVARRLLIDSYTWAAEAGQEGKNAARWMLGTPLWNALHAQATDSKTKILFTCQEGCSFETANLELADAHTAVTGHTMISVRDLLLASRARSQA